MKEIEQIKEVFFYIASTYLTTGLTNMRHILFFIKKYHGIVLDDKEKKKALQRGIRLDETRPGSGLGLSIVGEITREYEGQFSLKDADLGGLSAVLILPLAGH